MLRKKIEGTAVGAKALQMDALTENLMWPSSSPSPLQQGLLLEIKVTVVKTGTMKKEGYFRVVGQNANQTKCQLDIMPTKGWHFVRTFFCGWHFVRPNFWLTFCPEHLNMFWPFVRIMKNVVMP